MYKAETGSNLEGAPEANSIVVFLYNVMSDCFFDNCCKLVYTLYRCNVVSNPGRYFYMFGFGHFSKGYIVQLFRAYAANSRRAGHAPSQ